MKPRLIVLGYGSMAQAILSHNSHIATHYELFITGRDRRKAQEFINANALNARVLESKAQDSIDVSDSVLLFCVKPKGLASFHFTGRARCVYSAMAGVRVQALKERVDSALYVPFMPNIAARFKSSATAYYIESSPVESRLDSHERDFHTSELSQTAPARSSHALDSHASSPHSAPKSHTPSRPSSSEPSPTLHTITDTNAHAIPNTATDEITAFLNSFGISVRVDSESLIESSIATSGSSIAFLALVAEALIDSGVYEGLSHAQSASLVAQTFEGFARALREQSPSMLKYAIASPGGTTIRGLALLESRGVRGAFMEAASAAVKHARDSKKS